MNNLSKVCLSAFLLIISPYSAVVLTGLSFSSSVYGTSIITPDMLSNNSSSVPTSVTNTTQNASQVGFNFAAAGDWGCNANTEQNVKNIISKDPELVLSLGDNSYEESADCWLSIMEPIDEKMKIALGNHDTEEFPGLLEQYMSHFNLTKQYYSFDYENVHFLVMATDWPLDRYEEGSRQYNFVVSDLTKASANPNIDWIVVYYHNLAYTPPNDGAGGHDTLIEYHQLFQRFGVDMVIQAHVHAYSRTYPISFNPDFIAEPFVEYNGSNYYPNPAGQVYAIVGTGGTSFHDFYGKAPYEAYQKAYTHGFLNVDVINNGLTFNGTFIALNGTALDNFVIDKSVLGAERGNNLSQPIPTVSQSDRLLIDIGVGSTSLSLGDIQTISANVFAPDSPELPLGTAVVEISVVDPTGEDIYEFADDDGTAITELAIAPNFPVGPYTIEVASSAPGYVSSSEFFTFTVTE